MAGILYDRNLPKSTPKIIGGKTFILQVDTSATKLESNGKGSSIRYLFVTGEIEKGNVQVVYCPTKEMVADYFTKGLQEQLFRTHRNAILGITAEEVIKYKAA